MLIFHKKFIIQIGDHLKEDICVIHTHLPPLVLPRWIFRSQQNILTKHLGFPSHTIILMVCEVLAIHLVVSQPPIRPRAASKIVDLVFT